MSDLDNYEIFTQVAQSSSLTQAAIDLGITKASLSKKIKKLEQDLQVDLFSRANYRLSLTANGEVLLQQCLRLQKELDDTRSLCQKFHDKPEGVLRIVAFSYFVKNLLLPKLPEFLQMYPKLRITIDTSEQIPNLEQEQVDIALGFSLPAPNQEEIIQGSMGTTRYVLCGSPKYFNKYGKPKNLEDLHNHKYINHTSRPTSFLKLKPKHNLILKPYIEVNSVDTMIESALLGLGIIQIPQYVADKYLVSGEFVEILPEYQREGEHIYYYYPKYRHIQPKVRKFIDFFLV